jgi:hypothetical protein
MPSQKTKSIIKHTHSVGEINFVCPKCKTILTDRVLAIIEKITGIKKDEFNVGGLQKVITTFYAGEVVMKRVQADMTSFETTKQILKDVRELLKPELNQEEINKLQKE